MAATRAERHLLLSGATDMDKWPAAEPLEEPMRWIWRGVGARSARADGRAGNPSALDGRERARADDGVYARRRWRRCSPGPTARAARSRRVGGGGPSLRRQLPTVGDTREALPVSRLSYSGFEGYKRCGYRFYLERVLRVGEDR